MGNNSKDKPPTHGSGPSDEELKAQLQANVDEAKAKAAAAAALEAEVMRNLADNAAKLGVSAPPPRVLGDVPVVCQMTGQASLGGRRYYLIKNQEIMMHPDHAEEMAQVGHVKLVHVA